MPIKPFARLFLLGGLSLSTVFLGQSDAQGRPPEPPFAAIASDLGLSKGQVQSCFPKMEKPSSKSDRPARPDMDKIASCLKQADSALSDAQIKDALRKNAPKRG
ncbi:hypothetical protein [Aquicoccus sp. SU-CL01552]|uniref:hypothetical protein n=1 Tax=Aquicoccus sp. SU-CL01552 TaxID=3127656 RepID=UPI0031046801